MITIDWQTFIISVPKADMTLIQSNPIEIRELNLDTFRLRLKDIEDDPEGMGFQKTHNHNPPVTVGGVTLARVVNLLEPYTVTFEDGQYAVNLVGANSNVADRTNLNQVSVRSANSAGLIQTREIETASFQNAVHISTTGEAGTLYPIGTPARPVNNLVDAALIASVRSLKEYKFWSNWTFVPGDYIEDLVIRGRGFVETTFTFEFGSILAGCKVYDATCTGTGAGATQFTDCNILSFGTLEAVPPNDQDVIVVNCLLDGQIIIPSGYTGVIRALDCWATTQAGEIPVIDLNGAKTTVHMRNFSGHVAIRNCTDPDTEVYIYLTSGGIELEDSITAGQFVLAGNGVLVNEATSITLLDTGGLISEATVADAVWDADLELHSHDVQLPHPAAGVLLKLEDVQLMASGIKEDTTELLARLTVSRALLLDDIEGITTTVELLRKIQTNRLELADGTTDNWVLYDDNSTTPLLTWSVKGKSSEAITIPTGAMAKRDKAH